MPKPSSGIKHGASVKGAKPKGETVLGVLQSQIDKLKGFMDHQKQGSINAKDIQAQYAKVGITITMQHAQEVYSAIQEYSGAAYGPMRKAASKAAKGQPLTQAEQKVLAQYKLCEEYCKVAPTFKSAGVKMIHRGVSGYGAYAQSLMSLKPGQTWDLDKMPSSFSSQLHTAKAFAYGKGGILFHTLSSNIKNATSIKGVSLHASESEILVANYKWKIGKVDDQRKSGDGYYHIYLESA